MSTTASVSPSPPLPVSPSPPLLPPTPRDFDIHRMHLIDFASTRTIAQKHGISQTRVRQIVQRVNHWLAAALPIKTEFEQEQEIRLARHLAAEQLRNQIETLQTLWQATTDPKYFRQQNRSILALARLGIVPGAIDSLAADATASPLDPTEPQPPWSEDDPWANAVRDGEAPAEPRPSSATVPLPQPETCNSKPETSPASPPPSEDCSPSNEIHPDIAHATNDSPPTTASHASVSDAQQSFLEGSLEGLKLIEKRLLTLLENTNPTDVERRQSLTNTLHSTQNQKASLEIRLSRTSPPTVVPLQPTPIDTPAAAPLI